MVLEALLGNVEKAQPLHFSLLDGFDLLFAENNPAGVKAFLYELGIIDNQLRLPLVPLSENIHIQVKKFLAGLK